MALHALRQRLAELAIPRFATSRDRVRRLLDDDVDGVLPRLDHIAVVHWENLGDAVILSGLLRELRANAPDAQITLVHSAATTALFERCPYVDVRYSTVVRDGDGQARKERSYFRKMSSSAQLLRQAARGRPIDVVLGPDWLDPVAGHSWWDNVLCRRASGPDIIAARAAAGRSTEIALRQHHVPRTLALIESLGAEVDRPGPELWLNDDDRRLADGFVPADRPEFVAIAPAASVPRRCWPAERFGALARRLMAEHGLGVVVLGGEADRSLPGMDDLLSVPGIVDAVGALPLRASAALIERAVLLVGNDSGPAHLASAAGTPAVVVSSHPGSGDPWMFNSPMRYRPWGVPNEVLQPSEATPPCERGCMADGPHCILAIDVDAVAGAVADVLAAVRSR